MLQELDDEFLVIWDGFSNPPWQSFKEADLRHFLLERVKEGFSFPINPVWPVRDPGWYEVLNAAMNSSEGAKSMKAWFPAESGVIEKIKSLHSSHPQGFKVLKKDEALPRPTSGKDKPKDGTKSMLTNFMEGITGKNDDAAQQA